MHTTPRLEQQNRYSVLDNDDIKNNNKIVVKISGVVRVCELREQNDRTTKSLRLMEKQYKVEKAIAQKKNDDLAEKYNIEKITVNAMEAYLASLDDEYKKVKVSLQSLMKNQIECQQLKQRVTKLEGNIEHMANSHQVVVNDLQEEIDQQYATIRNKDKAIRNGSKELENLKKDQKKLNKERDEAEKRLNEKVMHLKNQLEIERRESSYSHIARLDLEKQLEIKCKEIKRVKGIFDMCILLINEYNHCKRKMSEKLDDSKEEIQY